MGIFGGEKESKEEKKERKTEELLSLFGMNELSDPQDRESIITILNEFKGIKKPMLQTAMDFNKTHDVLSVTAVEQNFIIIRQLDRISKQLEEIAKK
jgi:hypothetical protein